jgi:uncharacterized membrane protein
MKIQLKQEIWPIAVLLAMAVTAQVAYPVLSDRIPTHFDIHGQPNGYSDRNGFIAGMIGGCIALYFLLTFIPWIDPFRKKIEQRYDAFLKTRTFILTFFAIIFFLSIHAARINRFEHRWLGFGFSVLFITLGNYLPRLPRNFFFGVRTPWTLASDEVWRRTHILSGWLYVIGGILMLILVLFRVNIIWSMLGIVLPITFFCGFIYPYVLFRKLQKENTNNVQL